MPWPLLSSGDEDTMLWQVIKQRWTKQGRTEKEEVIHTDRAVFDISVYSRKVPNSLVLASSPFMIWFYPISKFSDPVLTSPYSTSCVLSHPELLLCFQTLGAGSVWNDPIRSLPPPAVSHLPGKFLIHPGWIPCNFLIKDFQIPQAFLEVPIAL